MNLARFFNYTRALETAVRASRKAQETSDALLVAKTAQWHATDSELTRETARRESAEAMREHFKGEVERLQGQLSVRNQTIVDLTDRICLKNHTVPVSEPLRSESPFPDPQNLGELLDQSVRLSGPVSSGRRNAEAQLMKRQAEEEAQRMRASVPVAGAAAAVKAVSLEELNDLAQTE
jgi:hypothetical protein